MRFLYINYEFPPLGGGGGRATAQIARHMAALGHEVVVLTSAFKGLPQEERTGGYLIRRIPTLRRHMEKCSIFEMVVFMISSIFYSVKLARKWNPDVSIAFFTIPSGPAALVLNKIFKIPYIISLRGGDVPGFMSEHLKFYHKITRWLIRYIWRGAKAVVANSEGLKRLALETSNDLPITTIPNGVDSDFFARGEKTFSRMTGGEKAFRILTVGRLTEQKGINNLLMAFRSMKPHLSTRPAQLWIVGDGPKRQSLEKLAVKLEIENDVFFLGWRDTETLKTIYSAADLFVLSSIDEGMPNVVLEAMAMGLPIVSTSISGASELVKNGQNGYLVPPRDPQALAASLHTVIQQKDLMNRMSMASRRMAKNYDWKTVTLEYLRLCGTAA